MEIGLIQARGGPVPIRSSHRATVNLSSRGGARGSYPPLFLVEDAVVVDVCEDALALDEAYHPVSCGFRFRY